jgi:hypothetical protein
LRTHAEVARGEPGAKKKLERLQAEYRTSGQPIERPGGTARLVAGPVTSLRPRQKPRRAVARSQDTSQRPYWMLTQRESWRLR